MYLFLTIIDEEFIYIALGKSYIACNIGHQGKIFFSCTFDNTLGHCLVYYLIAFLHTKDAISNSENFINRKCFNHIDPFQSFNFYVHSCSLSQSHLFFLALSHQLSNVCNVFFCVRRENSQRSHLSIFLHKKIAKLQYYTYLRFNFLSLKLG